MTLYINAVADCYVVLTTWFYNIIFKIKHKLYTASGSAPLSPKEKFWGRACHGDIVIGHSE
jgi:hypothetical protein